MNSRGVSREIVLRSCVTTIDGAKSRFVQPIHRPRQQFQKFKIAADEDYGRRCSFRLLLFDWIAVLQAEASEQVPGS